MAHGQHMDAGSSRDTSPDPIVLPSSPLGPNRKSTPRRASRKPTKTRGSPSKSLVLDTPNGAGGESPWRIRVTVEAEPREESAPAQKRRSASPSKKSTAVRTVALKVESPAEGDSSTKGNTRKRKGTPIRRGRSTRHQPPPPLVVEPEPASTVENDQDEDGDVMLHDEDMPPPARPSAGRRRISGRIGRLNSQSAPTLRSQRLSLAREELDIALQDAVGYGEEHTPRLLGKVDFSKSTRMLGDATLSRNEDFSMISAETLQTAKDSSLVSGFGNSRGSASGYMASSPPNRGSLRRSVLGEPVEFGRRSVLGKPVELERSRSVLGNPVEFGRSSALGTSTDSGRRIVSETRTLSSRNGADVMSWRPTGPPVVLRDLTPSSQLRPESHLRRSTASQSNEASASYGVNGTNDEDISQGLDADIWQHEASRSLEEQHSDVVDDDGDGDDNDDDDEQDELQAGHQLQSDAAAQTASHSPGLEDIFADQPLKPARGKIPKTWRRTSGMDFSYVDSPGHGVVEAGRRADDEEKRHSTDGSGVLTPPSTSEEDDEEEGVVVEEGDCKDDRDELNDVPSDEDDPEEEGYQEDPQSEWNQPDAEATRYEGQNHFEGQDPFARNVRVSPHSDDNDEDDDTGNFFQQNMPQVYAHQNRPRRPPRRPTKDEGTVDLSDLWDLKSSPVKAPSPATTSATTQPLQTALSSSGPRSAQLHGRPFDGKMKGNPPNGGKAKVVDSPLRKSLLKSSKMHGGSPNQKRQSVHHSHQAPAPALKDFIVPAPKRRQDPPEPLSSSSSSMPVLSPAVLDRSRTHFPTSQSRFEVESDSFASKASDQRQLIMEMTPRVGTGAQQSYLESTEAASSSPIRPLMRSYEEHLNVDSPQKIPVHFGDSSSVLPPTKLFLRQAGRKSVEANHFGHPVQQQQSQRKPLEPKPIPFVDRRAHSTAALEKVGGLFSRLSETFWSAVMRPTGPTAIYPQDQGKSCGRQQQQQQFQQDSHHGQAQSQHPQVSHNSTVSASWEDGESGEEITGMFNTTLRTAIRNRYGVLPSTFPWTMAHMRTLHRMLNSLASGREDSLIPNAGPLPEFLLQIVDTMQDTVSGMEFLFTREHAYVVFSFLQILVESEVVKAMERGEVQILGDGLSRKLRGVVEGDPRAGWDGVFRARDEWKEEGVIGWEFVVAALGCAAKANEVSGDQ